MVAANIVASILFGRAAFVLMFDFKAKTKCTTKTFEAEISPNSVYENVFVQH